MTVPATDPRPEALQARGWQKPKLAHGLLASPRHMSPISLQGMGTCEAHGILSPAHPPRIPIHANQALENQYAPSEIPGTG